jgi:hypothetical protein
MEYLLFHINFSATTHTISIWLGVSLAIFRYMHLQSSETGNLVHVRRIIRARIAIFAICACSVLILIPNYMSTNLESRPTANSTKVTYIIEDAKIGTPDVKLINFLNMCIYSIFAKFIPCFLMIVYGGLLLRTLDMQVRVKRRKMSKLGVVISSPLHTSRTTTLLLIVMILFLQYKIYSIVNHRKNIHHISEWYVNLPKESMFKQAKYNQYSLWEFCNQKQYHYYQQ